MKLESIVVVINKPKQGSQSKPQYRNRNSNLIWQIEGKYPPKKCRCPRVKIAILIQVRWGRSKSSNELRARFVIQGVCVCTICIDVKLLNSRGATAHLPMLPNEATEDAVEGFMDA